MTFTEYQKAALRSYCPKTDLPYEAETALLGAIGLVGEAGECSEPVKKWFFHGKGSHVEIAGKLHEELGDVLWYAAVLAHAFGLDLDAIAKANVDKLLARYPPPSGAV